MSELSYYIKLRSRGCNTKLFECDKYLDCESCLEDKIKEHDKQIRAEVIEEIKKKVHPCDNCNMCKTQEEFEYNYEACVYDEEVKLTKF